MKHISVLFDSDEVSVQTAAVSASSPAAPSAVQADAAVAEEEDTQPFINRRRTGFAENLQAAPAQAIQSQPVQPAAVSLEPTTSRQIYTANEQALTSPMQAAASVEQAAQPLDLPEQQQSQTARKHSVGKAHRWLWGLGKFALSTVAVFIVLLGAGVAYTYVIGRSNGVAAPAATTTAATASVNAMATPRTPAKDVPVSVAVQSMTTPVVRGGTVSMTIKSVPTAMCTPTIAYNGKQATIAEFNDQMTDQFGIATWEWIVARDTPSGRWPIAITCKYNGRSAVGGPDLVVM